LKLAPSFGLVMLADGGSASACAPVAVTLTRSVVPAGATVKASAATSGRTPFTARTACHRAGSGAQPLPAGIS